jgi:ribosomal protein L13E
MTDNLLTLSQKEKLVRLVNKEDFASVIAMLDSLSTAHAKTAKMKDKQFVISEIIKYILQKYKTETKSKREKFFYLAGKKICGLKSDNAKEIGIHIHWRGYNHNKKAVTGMLLKTADDKNWEVREYAAGAISAAVYTYGDFYKKLEKWRKHKSENVRRAVVMSAWGLRDKKDINCTEKAFALLEPLLYDSSVYVKKNLGPFVIGSGYGNAFPEETFRQLDKWIKIKDPHVRWNIAMAFNNSFGNKYPERALGFLKVLSKDTNKIVQRAVVSTLRTLRKRHKSLIDNFLRERKLKI